MRRTFLLGVLCGLFVVCLAQTGCGGNGFLSALGFDSGGGQGSQPNPNSGGPRADFARTLLQLQWACIALGVAGLIASFWIPLISTRHAVGALVVGIGIALVRPLLVFLYWPTIACVVLAALAAAWPYIIAAYAWVRTRFSGQPAPVATVGLMPSLKSLVMARDKAAGPRFDRLPVGSPDSHSGPAAG